MKNKILFVNPDFHSTFFQAEGINALGWEASIFVGLSYPSKLLYTKKNVYGLKKIESNFFLIKTFNILFNILELLYIGSKNDYIIYYGNPPELTILNPVFKFIPNFAFELFYFKTLLKKKIIFQPSGCKEEMLKKDFLNFDQNICSNCGFFERCDDRINKRHFSLIEKYSDLNISFGFFNTSYYKNTHFKYKSIDLNLWSSVIKIPEEYLLPKVKGIRILHSSFLKQSGRDHNNKNIKGTPFIIAAIEKLQREGFEIEKMIIENIPINKMRFYQAQADIVVDQLIYGHWGSTAVECMALGKPVICHLNKRWKENFMTNYPEYNSLPIIEADTSSIYKVLKELIQDKERRENAGIASRKFVEAHYSPKTNAKILQEQLLQL
jgi:glycosyltransferase involved in cell wall biosynthesis